MGDFWNEVILSRLGERTLAQAWDDLSREVSFRPTLYIGLGGFGCMVIRSLKRRIEELIPERQVRDGFAFIGLDTHPHDRNDILTINEYIALSMGVLPDNVARDPSNPHLGWYTNLVGSWGARAIQDGANKVRVVGRLAFLNPPAFQSFNSALGEALNRIMSFRENFNVTAPPKVYLISSLAGGTGSGFLLDLLFITTYYLREQYGANYQLQVILSTPEALEGEARAMDLPDFYANTYATLKEMFHFILGGEESVSYGIPGFERVRVTGGEIPHTIYLITDRNTDGRTIVKEFPELAELVTSYLLSEILTPLSIKLGAQPRFQDGENQLFDEPGHGEMPRVFSSFGVVRFGLPYEEVEELLTLSLVYRAITDELAITPKLDVARSWIRDNHLTEAGSDQLQERIRKDREGHPIKISLDLEGILSDVKRTELGERCKEVKKELENYLRTQYLPLLKDNATGISDDAKKKLQGKFDEIMENESLGSALVFLSDLTEELKTQKEALSEELKEYKEKLQKASNKVDQSIEAVEAAAQSGFFGRKGRIKAAIQTLDGDMEVYLNLQIVVWSQEQGIRVYDDLISSCGDIQKRWGRVRDVLESRRNLVGNRSREVALEIDRMADINSRGPGNRFSIVDSTMVKRIYDEYIGEEGERGIALQARREWKESGLISDLTSSDREWVEKAQQRVRSEVEDRIKGLNLVEVIEEFYPPGRDRDDLFISIIALSSPLFPLDPNRREPQYSDEYIVAVNPRIRDDFLNLFNFPPGVGVGHAYFSNEHEAIIYSISRGYTAHSLTRLNVYKTHYEQLQNRYERAFIEGRPHRPIHAWVGAEDWEEPIPEPREEEEAYKWFIVGRAFSYLFPTAVTADGKPDESGNQAFIYARDSRYYLIADDGSPQKIGDSFEDAVDNFKDHPEWRDRIKKLAEDKIREKGRAAIKEQLEEKYMPRIDEEIERAERDRDLDYMKSLRKLRRALEKFIKEELRERGI